VRCNVGFVNNRTQYRILVESEFFTSFICKHKWWWWWYHCYCSSGGGGILFTDSVYVKFVWSSITVSHSCHVCNCWLTHNI